jgi:hypothetical protein
LFLLQRQFDAYAEEIVKALELEKFALTEAVEAFTTSVVSFTNATGERWPFVTIPDFERRGQSFNSLTHATHVGVFPLVTVKTRAAYEEYTSSHQGWLHEGLVLRGEKSFFPNISNISDCIFHIQGINDSNVMRKEPAPEPIAHSGPGDFLPVWQQAPAPSHPEMINYDLFEEALFRRNYRIMWEAQRSVFSEVAIVDLLADPANQTKLTDPSSVILHPIYPYFTANEEYERNTVVAVLVAVLPWRREFENILRPGTSAGRFLISICWRN